jgi:hypothetical protein
MTSRPAAPDSPEDRETMRRDFERGVYEREEAESESRCDALHRNPLDSNDLRAWRHLAYKLEHQYALAQAEIKGHMRVEDELKARIAELEKDVAVGAYVRKHLAGGPQHIVDSMVISQRDLDAIDAALKDRA